MKVLYGLSSVMYLIVSKLIRYRHKVILENLRNSFPSSTLGEINAMRSSFYRYFCDMLVESVKSLSISETELKERLEFVNTDVFRKHFENRQSVVVLMGHWGNWEWAGLRFALEPLHSLAVVYKPPKNAQADKLARTMRSRFGSTVIPMKAVLKSMLANQNAVTATTFIADQVPSYGSAHRLTFLHQDTRVFLGAAKIAHKLNYPVIYAGVKRVSRGRYKIHLSEIEAAPRGSSPEKITERFFQLLEADIRTEPETWLWSHKRWKHKQASSITEQIGEQRI
ncbi:MAG: hypothetical protein RL266_1960 [Bacteroidota bacterium]